MVGYSKDVADRVLRILQAGSQLEADKVRELMASHGGKSQRVLQKLIDDGFDE